MDNGVRKKFESYPDNIRPLFTRIRSIILETAEQDCVGEIEETLKWNEPSYLIKGGSTVRIDWKPKYPHHFFVYFNCKTSLIETFKEVYGDLFTYDGNRAIVLEIAKKLPEKELKQCISMSLRYHKIKHLPLLGA